MMAEFESMRDDLERMWSDMNRLFDTVDNDIMKTLNRYGSSIMSLNEKMMESMPEESPATHGNISIPNSNDRNSEVDIYNEHKHEEKDIFLNSDIFLIDDNINHNNDTECLLDTISMKRIIYILGEYNKWLSLQIDFEDDNGYDGIYDFLNNYLGNGTYNISKLLNDFYFVLYNDKYNIDNEFEDIYECICNYIIKESNDNTYSSIINQYYFEQNQYEKCHTNIQRENYYGKYWNNSKEIIALQILNKIYFYFLHSIDIGYKLTINDKIFIEKQI
eukprot:299637_1